MDRKSQIELAAKLLKLDVEIVEKYATDLENLNAVYISEKIKGGRSLIVADDGSVLYADSSIPPQEHIKAFLDGIRTPIEAFQ